MNNKHLTAAKQLLKKAQNLHRHLAELNVDICDELNKAHASAASKASYGAPLIDFLVGLNQTVMDAETLLELHLPDEGEVDDE